MCACAKLFLLFFKTPVVTLQFIPISSPFSSARATSCTCHISKCWQQIYHLQLAKDYERQICACVSVCWLHNYCILKALFARSFISLKVQSLSSLPFSNTVTISSYTHTDAHLYCQSANRNTEWGSRQRQRVTPMPRQSARAMTAWVTSANTHWMSHGSLHCYSTAASHHMTQQSPRRKLQLQTWPTHHSTA